jgi:hypothetical protein
MSAKMRELEFKVSETAKSQKHVETSCQVLSDFYNTKNSSRLSLNCTRTVYL